MVYVFDMQTFGMVALKIGTNLALETAATTADGSKIYLASSSNDRCTSSTRGQTR